MPNLLEENRRIHALLTEGVDVEYYADDGVLTAGKVWLLDFDRPENNDWLAVQQFVVISGQDRRRPDVVLFVNGLPLAVIELKAPGSAGAHLVGAFNQLQTYKQQIPALFHTNALLVTSDGIAARVGSLSADLERFMPWRTTDGKQVLPKGQPELPTLIEGYSRHNGFWSCCAGSPPSAKPVAGWSRSLPVTTSSMRSTTRWNRQFALHAAPLPKIQPSTARPALKRSRQATAGRGDLAYAG